MESVYLNFLLIQSIAAHIIDHPEHSVSPDTLERLSHLLDSVYTSNCTASSTVLRNAVVPIAEAIRSLLSRPNFFQAMKGEFDEHRYLLELVELALKTTALSILPPNEVILAQMVNSDLPKITTTTDTSADITATSPQIIANISNDSPALESIKSELESKALENLSKELNQSGPTIQPAVVINKSSFLSFISPSPAKCESSILSSPEAVSIPLSPHAPACDDNNNSSKNCITLDDTDTILAAVPIGPTALFPVWRSERWRCNSEERVIDALQEMWAALANGPRATIYASVWSFSDSQVSFNYVKKQVELQRRLNFQANEKIGLEERDYFTAARMTQAAANSQVILKEILSKPLDDDSYNIVQIAELILKPNMKFVSEAQGTAYLTNSRNLRRILRTLGQVAVYGLFATSILASDKLMFAAQLSTGSLLWLKTFFPFLSWPVFEDLHEADSATATANYMTDPVLATATPSPQYMTGTDSNANAAMMNNLIFTPRSNITVMQNNNTQMPGTVANNASTMVNEVSSRVHAIMGSAAVQSGMHHHNNNINNLNVNNGGFLAVPNGNATPTVASSPSFNPGFSPTPPANRMSSSGIPMNPLDGDAAQPLPGVRMNFGATGSSISGAGGWAPVNSNVTRPSNGNTAWNASSSSVFK